ncbi:hypothetical protein [Salinibacterium sp. ZJ454]|uniref:hypothetical protein n=1 Tax=Salinibacterium sp. ZJ454 TaxID=2708339 RepID=UPI001423189D|nr:hypothetical protein [Salinibacterium sp. ZJ454]
MSRGFAVAWSAVVLCGLLAALMFLTARAEFAARVGDGDDAFLGGSIGADFVLLDAGPFDDPVTFFQQPFIAAGALILACSVGLLIAHAVRWQPRG